MPGIKALATKWENVFTIITKIKCDGFVELLNTAISFWDILWKQRKTIL